MTDTDVIDRAPYKYTRGPVWISYLYLIWRQVLAYLDLLGPDGRPSSTKLIAAFVTIVLATIGVMGSIKGVEHPWNWPMFWTQMSVFAVLFGRTQFREYLSVLKGKDTPPGLDA